MSLHRNSDGTDHSILDISTGMPVATTKYVGAASDEKDRLNGDDSYAHAFNKGTWIVDPTNPFTFHRDVTKEHRQKFQSLQKLKIPHHGRGYFGE
jgi:hypothetical protein